MRWPWSRKQRVEFDGTPRNIVELFAEMASASGTTVTREQALSVPAVRRGRNLICSVATMQLEQRGPDNEVEPSALLRQIDPDVPNIVTIAQTVDDLLFDSIAWWLVTATDFAGYPVSARHLDVRAVSLEPPANGKARAPLPSDIDPRGGVVWVDGKPVAGNRVIRFDSPNPAVLKHAGREIRRAIALDKAAVTYASDPRPADYFTPTPGAEELSDEQVLVELAKWKAARKRRATGYVPASMTYHSVDSPAPRDLQLVELQRQVNLDIANALGIDPEDLGISTTSRTYANDVDRRRNKLNEVLGPYMRAVTDRLSMGDVTRRGYTVRFNTTDYLQPNPTERWATYSSAKAIGAMTVPEIREAERMPPLPDPPPQAPPPQPGPDAGQGTDDDEPEPEADTVNASRPATMTFDGPSTFTLDVPVVEFSVDRENRIIEGLAVPYGQLGSKGGLTFEFDQESMTWDAEHPGRVKLMFPRHGQAVGKAIQLRNTRSGLLTRFKVGRGPDGDKALTAAEDEVFDGLSVGVDFDPQSDAVPHPRHRGALLVRRADLRHVALTDEPVFTNARVTKVAASRSQEGATVPDENTDQSRASEAPETTTEQPAAGVQLTADQLSVLLGRPGALQALTAPATQPDEAAAVAPDGGLTLSADQVDALVQSGHLGALLGLPGSTLQAAPAVEPERPEPVNPTRGTGVELTREALPYQFDRGGNFVPTEHVFSADLHEMALNRDHRGEATDAGKRVMGLLRAVFDTDAADVNELNPAINRPDMYVDQRDYRYPLWNAINKGGPPNGVQPFTFPKFSSASGLVGDHTEGTEPVAGTFVATNQTVTPTSISGKASITREVWDMGGNPAVSTLIFNQMVRGWREGLETAAATFLNTLTAATDIALGVAVVDEALVAAWDAAVAGLQFVRGYDFEMFAVEQQLYMAFVAAVDSNGRKLVPQVSPSNASGTAARRFATLDLAGVTGSPSWALPSTAGALNNSWLFDPSVVHGWATPPQRLEFPGSGTDADYQPVAHVDLAIWGYKAFANSDIGGVRQVTYDSTV